MLVRSSQSKISKKGSNSPGGWEVIVSMKKTRTKNDMELTITPGCGGGCIPLGSNSGCITGTIVGAAINAASWLFLKLPIPLSPRWSQFIWRVKRICANDRTRSTTCCLYILACVGQSRDLTRATMVERK